MNKALQEDHSFALDCLSATVHRIQLFQERAHSQIQESLQNLSPAFSDLPFDDWFYAPTPILAIKAQTE